LRLISEFENKKLRIVELRIEPARVGNAAWAEGDSEPAMGIAFRMLKIQPPQFEEEKIILASIGQHALARRYPRGSNRSDAAIFRDL
jgi:hypothetical protein